MMVSLPKDGYKDFNTLDWICSIKTAGGEASQDDFNDLMTQNFNKKAASGGISRATLFAHQSIAGDRVSSGPIEQLIEKDDPIVTQHLIAMTEAYGEQKINEMTPSEFYKNYKQFVANSA